MCSDVENAPADEWRISLIGSDVCGRAAAYHGVHREAFNWWKDDASLHHECDRQSTNLKLRVGDLAGNRLRCHCRPDQLCHGNALMNLFVNEMRSN